MKDLLFALSGGEFAVLFWATIGGFIVFFGLAIEKIADWMNDRFLGGTEKPHKTLELAGWCILMLGILIEIAVAGWSANDAWQTRQLAIKNDPHNLPIFSMSAYAVVVIRQYPQYGAIDLNGLQKSAGALGMRIENDQGQNLRSSLILGRHDEFSKVNWLDWGRARTESSNVSPSVSVVGNENLLRLDLFFENPEWFSKRKELSVNDVDAIVLYLPAQGEVIEGRLEMTFNGSLTKTFLIPAQKTYFGAVTSVATNGAFVPFDFDSKK